MIAIIGRHRTHAHHGEEPFDEVVAAKELSLRANFGPHGLKEQTNREKTKVATMGLE
jgi:hypothetical protein